MAMGERKFSEDLEIKLDDHQNNIENLEIILANIKKIDDETELKNVTEYYFRIIENHDMINKEQLKQIIDALKNKKENVIEESPKEEIKDKIDRMKKDNKNLSNISIIETSKKDNDNTDGLRRDVTYLEFNDNGNKILYEIENMDLLNKVLSDFDLLKGKNSYELLDIIDNYCKKCQIIHLETKQRDLPTDNYKKEMNSIISERAVDVINSNDNIVLKERVDFKDFVNKFKRGEEISYALNSNGERIYIVGDEKYKFIGEDRELKKLSQDSNEENDIGTANFNSEMKGRGKLEEIDLNNFVHITNFIGQENLIIYIMRAMEYNIGISEKQNDFLARFVTLGMECKVIGIPIPGESLGFLYQEFMKRFGENKLQIMISKGKTLEQQTKDDVRKLKLTPPKNNKLSNWEKAGFISVAIIIESSLILGGLFAILALVKK